MGQPRRKAVGDCLVAGCTRPVSCRGLCAACYAIHNYHKQLNHDALYWKEYDEATKLRDSRSDAFTPTRKSRRGIKAVK